MSDAFEAMSDDALRDFVKDRDGRRPHPQSSREVLLAKARKPPSNQQPNETPMSDATAPDAPSAPEFDRPEDVPANPDAGANIAAAAASAPVDDAARQAAIKAARSGAKSAATAPEPTRLEKVGRNEELSRAQKIERMQAARRTQNGAVDDDNPFVEVRVTKKGDMQVSTGEHLPGLGDIPYEHKETFSCRLDTAKELEDRGLVEIQD